MSAKTLREVQRQVLVYIGLAPFVVIAIFPVVWMAITAFKQDADLYRLDVAPLWFHLPPTLEHFTRLVDSTYFTVQLLNTLQLAACVVALTMVMAVPAGYALARLRLPGAENLGIAIFLTYLVPPIILFIPLARVVGALGVHAREDEREEESIHAGLRVSAAECRVARAHSTGRAGSLPCSARSVPIADSKSSSDSNAWYTLANRRYATSSSSRSGPRMAKPTSCESTSAPPSARTVSSTCWARSARSSSVTGRP